MTATPGFPNFFISECEKEPIHIRSRIQPFGVLMTADPDTLVIQNLSENCLKLWDRHSFALLGRCVSEFMSGRDFDELRRYLAAPSFEAQAPLRITLAFDEFIKREWEMRAHRHHDVLYLEWEVAGSGQAGWDCDDFPVHLRQAVSALQSADSMQALYDRASEQMQHLTGFDRVMLCRFSHGWHGEVVSEACRNGLSSYLGQRFSASDSPEQACALFMQKRLHMIPDVDYTPARIHPGTVPDSGAPLDLSRAWLRSVSPAHIESLKNMRVKASLSIALKQDERLLGLITCHHESPLKVNKDARMAAELLADLLASRIVSMEGLSLRT